MSIFTTIKSKQSFIKNEIPAMGPGDDAPEEAINGAQ